MRILSSIFQFLIVAFLFLQSAGASEFMTLPMILTESDKERSKCSVGNSSMNLSEVSPKNSSGSEDWKSDLLGLSSKQKSRNINLRLNVPEIGFTLAPNSGSQPMTPTSDSERSLDFETQILLNQVVNLPKNFELTGKDRDWIFQALRVAQEAPNCPISHFQVGCIILLEGHVGKGVNFEDPSMSNACCGERSAIWGTQPIAGKVKEQMEILKSYVFALNPTTKRVETGISSSCGLCRQTYANCGNPTIYFTYHDRFQKMTARELLPDPYLFLPERKIVKTHRNEVSVNLGTILNLTRSSDFVITDQLKEVFHAAISASQHAYAQYYKIREGAAILVESNHFKSGFKIFKRANYQNASYGVSQGAVSELIRDINYQMSELDSEHEKMSESYTLRYLALFAFDDADNLVMNVSPSGGDRQVAVEEDSGLELVCFYAYENILRFKTMGELLPFPFRFKEITKQRMTL